MDSRRRYHRPDRRSDFYLCADSVIPKPSGIIFGIAGYGLKAIRHAARAIPPDGSIRARFVFQGSHGPQVHRILKSLDYMEIAKT